MTERSTLYKIMFLWFLIFTMLKVSNIINVSWLFVTFPLWGTVCVWLLVISGAILVGVLAGVFKSEIKNQNEEN